MTSGPAARGAQAAGLTVEEWLARRDAGLRRCWRCTEWLDASEAFSPRARQCRKCITSHRGQDTDADRAVKAARAAEHRLEREAQRRRAPVLAAQAERLADALAGLPVDDHPPAAVRDVLAQARDLGCDFDAAWPLALGRIVDDDDHGGGEGWRNALECTRRAWDAAYTRVPDGHLARLGALDLPAFDDVERMAREPAVPPSATS